MNENILEKCKKHRKYIGTIYTVQNTKALSHRSIVCQRNVLVLVLYYTTFNENTETIDSYVIRIRQVATLLGYGDPQILEVFRNTLPTKLYWILFPLEDLR